MAAYRHFVFLLAVIASAHALVRGFAGAATAAGFNLNAVQGAIVGVFTMILAALYAAADVMVWILLIHNNTSVFLCLSAILYCPQIISEIHC